MRPGSDELGSDELAGARSGSLIFSVQMASEKPLIFVSCGQYTASERQLGRDICHVLSSIRPDLRPYFAEEQSTVEGLNSQVLKALHRAAGFICAMHRRGDLNLPDGRRLTRGSVWVEQEIAIAAFMDLILKRSIPTLFYKQAGVSLEGIRSVLLMNPRVEFTEESQVLEDLESALPSIAFTPFDSYAIVPAISYRLLGARSNRDRHFYSLTCDVKNVGTERVTDFKIRVFFPRAFLNSSTTWGAEDRSRSTKSHVCFASNAEGRAPGGLYPGDGARNPLEIEYFVDDALHDDAHAMQSEIVVELFSGSMTPKKQILKIKDYQEF